MKYSIVLAMSLLAHSFCQANDKSDGPVPQYESEGISIPPAASDEPFAQLSIGKAAAYLDQGAVAWSREQQCITCHTNGTYLFIRPALTSTLGPPAEEVRGFFLDQLTTLQQTKPEALKEGVQPAQLIYLAAGLAQWDMHVSHTLSEETKAALRLMLEVQNEDGAWGAVNCWPPFESSAYQEATMAAMALSAAPNWLADVDDDPVTDRIERLRTYLRETDPPHNYARVLKLWTSVGFDGILQEDERTQIISMVLQKQQPGGGWNMRDFALPEEWGDGNRADKLRAEPDVARATSDGHMTGLALIVLQHTDAPGSTESVRRGVGWLKSHQRESGRWWTRSLNTDTRHFITFSGTAYPLLALQLFEAQ